MAVWTYPDVSSAANQVSSQFNAANGFASTAALNAQSFVDGLTNSVYQAPIMSVTWHSISPPTLATLPEAPTLTDVTFEDPGGQPSVLTEGIPTVDIDDFTDAAPDLTFPTAPVVSYGVAPTVPTVGDVSVPTAPEVVLPNLPSLLTVGTVTFDGVNLREEWLDNLGDLPQLDLVQPAPFTHNRGPDYASQLLTALKDLIRDRLNGGTGLPPDIEQLIWDRARDRETKTALANEAEIARQSESFGFQLPTGVLVAQLREAQKGYFDKLSELSRDIAIKQAELEVDNLKSSIEQGVRLEAQLMDYTVKIEQLAFEISKGYADNAVQVYNANIEGYKALLAAYQTYASTYKTIIDAELAKVEVYKAQLQAEQTKANVNMALVTQYKTQIEGALAVVDIFKAQVSAAQTLVDLEKTKIEAAGEQIRAYTATVNAEVAKVEVYKAQVQGEATKVEAYRTKAAAFSAKAGAQAERARAYVARYSALAQAKAAEWDGYKARVVAASAKVDALAKQNEASLDSYKLVSTAAIAQAETTTKVWEGQMKQYEAQQNYMLQAAKINNDNLMHVNDARLEAAKVAAQVNAQLAASAFSTIQANASIGMNTSISQNMSLNISQEAENTANI